jgi:hypothetical protein
MKTLKDDIKIIIGLDLPILLMWMNEKSALERFERDEIAYSITIIKVRSKTIVDWCITKGIDFSGKNHKVELFLEAEVDIICSKCSQFGHDSYKNYQESPKCAICGGKHKIKDHKCSFQGYTSLTGHKCFHTALKCINCEGPHLATFSYCPKRLEVLKKQRLIKKELYKLQQSRQKIAVMISIITNSNKVSTDIKIKTTPQNPSKCW